MIETPYKCRGYLFILYDLLKMSALKIATECGVMSSTIWRWLKKFNIVTRTHSKAVKGAKNPMYGKHHSPETKQKISKAKKGKYTGVKHPMYGRTGVNNPNWKNWEELSGYSRKHVRMKQALANMGIFKPDYCPVCNVKDTRIELINLDHTYQNNILDYYYLCQYCHDKIYHCLIGIKKSKKIPVDYAFMSELFTLQSYEKRRLLLNEVVLNAKISFYLNKKGLSNEQKEEKRL